MRWKRPILLLGALAWIGCARTVPPQVRYTETMPAQARTRPRPAPARIAILAARAPQRAYQRIGEIEVRTAQGDDADRAAMLAALRYRAAQAGCDAVLLHGPWYEAKTDQPVYRRFVTRSEPIYRAACIVYHDLAPDAPGAGHTHAPETDSPPVPDAERTSAPDAESASAPATGNTPAPDTGNSHSSDPGNTPVDGGASQ